MKKLLIALLTLSCVLCFAGCKNPFARENPHGRIDYIEYNDNNDDDGEIDFKEPRIGRKNPLPAPTPIPSPIPVIPR